MMARRLMLLVAVLLAASAAPALGVEVTVSDLVERGSDFAGSEVTVVGEFVGDYGARRNGLTWTQMNGDSYAYAPVLEGGPLVGTNIGIGVRFPTELGNQLDPPGGYSIVGPIVEVTGTWKYHDPDRQGESYLDATRLTVIAPGRALAEPANWFVYGAGLVLLVLAGALLVAHRNARASRDRAS